MTSQNSESQDGKVASSHRNRKIMNITVYFLDDSSHIFQLQAKSLGQLLFDKVCKFLNLLEVDYFGLEYEDDKKAKCWLDALKPLCSQISTSFPTMYFCVKFYTPDPVQLEDEFTRYLFGLQVKKDLINGHLQCNDNTAAVMISYIVQADFGDYNPEKCSDGSYISGCKFVPFQDAELERKVLENHKKIIGQTPAEADLNLLETARRCELYGIRMTPAKDPEGVPLNLAVAHLGVLVFQNFTKINTFSWVKIRKLSFKRKKFLIKLHPEGYGYYKDTVEYFFESRNECKNFWKKCIENHTFFRCTDAKQGMRQKPKIFSRGSSFRYSGRTQKQVSEYVRENCFKRQPFQRSTSLRTPSSPSRSIGAPLSPQPLLPVTSLSCGSISDISKEALPPQKVHSTSEPTTPHIAPELHNSINDQCSGTPDTPASGPVSPDGEYDDDGQDIPDHQTEKNNNKPTSQLIQQNGTNFKTQINNVLNHSNKSPSFNTDSFQPEVESIYNQENLSQLKTCASIEYIPNRTLSTNSISRLSADTSFEDHQKNIDSNYLDDNHVKNVDESYNVLHDVQQNFGSSTFYVSSPYAVRLANKKRSLSDKTYCLAKELLMTERTYRKDLEIVDVVFREEFYAQTEVQSEAAEEMLSIIDPLYEKHCSLLRDLEQRLAFWEGRPGNRGSPGIKGVSDVLLLHKGMIEIHSIYLEKLPDVLKLIFEDLQDNEKFCEMYNMFEAQKICYLPLTSFLLKPAFRLLYYYNLLKDLLSCYNSQHPDFDNCVGMLNELKNPCENLENKIAPVMNFTKLMELQRSLIGFPKLVDKNRNFIREGCLFKLTKHGSHQHMFFLFSDVILYTVHILDGQLQFKVQGKLPTSGLKVEEIQPMHGMNHCFSLCTSEKHIIVGAPSAREHSKWLQDLQRCALNKTSSSHPLNIERCDSSVESDDIKKVESHLVNTSIHVCWHRNISISSNDLLLSMKHSLSGYLLRKFKNSSGWQKVWVVLANLCLFFYRSYLDESPLASLPLAGYKIKHTTNGDLVFGDCIFKLVFKTHEYFFTVENKHTFERWMEAISVCTLMDEENTRL
ncbi:FERM, ARHGEF and pleckstrin domain-containing protein 2-like isoform X2 [Argiope bruennichi]|uniref:FERM, ARHGEF and pleckstrin domain-containing protein 2-like isoform X2 n=1 Tax=Argiope bruennichi TaxID=94029 RepID=UPI0024954AA8|nr:FERM, ARHGEF and pleckstrin domain-containing protein 2-like isoform X2 [Argiope bruennichi]